MPHMILRWKLAAIGFLCYAAIAISFGGAARGQKKDGDTEKKPIDSSGWQPAKITAKPIYFGIKSCSSGGDLKAQGCHNWEKPQDMSSGSPLCQCNELRRWRDNDKHHFAYTVIDTQDPKNDKADRARRMEKILANGDEKYKVYEDKRCLACHALVVNPDIEKAKTFDLKEGVNCVVCHGAYREWVIDHPSDLSGFDKLTRAEKEEKKGLIDLWNPVRRAQLCASCHVGNLASPNEQKFVTHEMYAAGHPPLPSFEVAVFSNEMPRHWLYIRQKPDKAVERQHLKKSNFRYEETQLVLVGAAVTLVNSMNLLVAEADKAIAGKDVLDLSNFDCYACHHDLQNPSWRQERGYGKGKPGRVPMKNWPAVLVKLACHYGAADEAAGKAKEAELKKQLDDLDRAFQARPYGEAKAIKAAAEKLAAWAKELAGEVNMKVCTAADAARLRKIVPTLYKAANKSQWLDFDSARQVAWAYKVLYFEHADLNWEKPQKETPVVKEFEELNKHLRLKLPASPKVIETDLGENLKALNSYKPVEFTKFLQRLSGNRNGN